MKKLIAQLKTTVFIQHSNNNEFTIDTNKPYFKNGKVIGFEVAGLGPKGSIPVFTIDVLKKCLLTGFFKTGLSHFSVI